MLGRLHVYQANAAKQIPESEVSTGTLPEVGIPTRRIIITPELTIKDGCPDCQQCRSCCDNRLMFFCRTKSAVYLELFDVNMWKCCCSVIYVFHVLYSNYRAARANGG